MPRESLWRAAGLSVELCSRNAGRADHPHRLPPPLRPALPLHDVRTHALRLKAQRFQRELHKRVTGGFALSKSVIDVHLFPQPIRAY